MKNKIHTLRIFLIALILVLSSILVSAGDFNIYNASDTTQTYFAVNGTTGNIGIGISDPTTLLQLLNNRWISAKNYLGTGIVNMFKVSQNDSIELGATLNIGSFKFNEDSGLVTFVDMPVSSTPAAGTSESYVFKVDGDNIMIVYSEADGSGGVQNKRVGIGTITPQNTLNVIGDGNFTGSLYGGTVYSGGSIVLTSFTETDPLWTGNQSLYYLKSNPFSFVNTSTASNLNYLILSKWANITDAPTTLGFFTDDLGDRGYTHLTNFTDDILWTSGFNTTGDSRWLTSFTETDPLWTANQSSYWNTGTDLDTVISTDEITELKIDFNTACAAGNHLYVSGNNLACEADDDTTYTASGTLLNLTGTTFSVNEGNLTNAKGCKFVTGTGIVCDQDYLTSFTETDPHWTGNFSSKTGTGNVVFSASPTFTGTVNAAALTLSGTLTANGVVALGDGGDDIAINSNDWDISSAGAISGITSIDGSGDLTMGTITMTGFTVDGSGNTDALSLDVGGGYGNTGATISSAGALQIDGNLNVDGGNIYDAGTTSWLETSGCGADKTISSVSASGTITCTDISLGSGQVTDVWVNESGDTMTGNLNMNNNNITSVTKLTLNDENIGVENITFDGDTSAGLKLSNSDGYITLTPLNSGWAHIYTDRANFIFNQPVWSLDDAFSSYDANLLLQRAGVTKITASTTAVTIADDLTVSGGDITLGTTSIFSGGDTASLNNIDAINSVTETTFESALDHDQITGAGTVDTTGEVQSVAVGGDLSGTVGSASVDNTKCTTADEYLGGDGTCYGEYDAGDDLIGTIGEWQGQCTNCVTDGDVVDTITASNYVRKSTWTDIDDYPSGCSAGQAVRVIGDTLTCINISSQGSETLDGYDSSFFMPLNTSVVGNFSFNGGWTEGGLSIIEGDIYAQQLFVYNISHINVSNLNINGSLLPQEGFDNQFDLGSSSLRWNELYLGGKIYAADWTNVSITESQISDLQEYYLKSNPFGFYNSTNPQTETDPKWTGNFSSKTGTGNVVFSASPTFTGTVGAAAITATGTVTANSFTGAGTGLTGTAASLTAGTASTALTGDSASAFFSTGTLEVARGGTGISSYTTGNYIRASGTTTLEQRTPAEVRSDIGAGTGDGTVTSISQGTGMSFSTNPITTTGTINLANTAVTPGSYGSNIAVGTFTVDQQGRLTAAGSTTIRSGTTAQTGVVQLTNSVSSTSTTTAAVPANVKTAYDTATAKASPGTCSSGQVVQNTTTGGVQCVDVDKANAVNGTGTQNTIAKWTGTGTLGDSGINDLSNALAITIDSSERVGIGTTTPQNKLNVVGDLNVTSTSTFMDTVTIDTGKWLRFYDNDGTYPTAQGGFQWDLNNDDARIYAHQPASDQIDFVFKIADNVGTTDRFIYWIDSHTGASDDAYPLYMDGTKVVMNYPNFYSSGDSQDIDFYLMGNGSTALSQAYFFGDAVSKRIGIGTTTPQQRLHVNGSAVINGTLNMDSNKIISLGNGTSAQDAVTLSQLQSVNESAVAEETDPHWTGNQSSYWDTSTDLDTVISTDEITELKIDFNTVCGAGNHLYVSGNNLACEADDDTTYTASGTLLNLTGTTFSVNAGTLTNAKGCKFVTDTGIVCDQDYLTSFTETDPLWTGNWTNVAFINKANAFGAFNQSFDTNVLFVDATNNRIGIGTTVPTHELNVVGDANITGTLHVLGTVNATMFYGDGLKDYTKYTDGNVVTLVYDI